jgi:hypothetical protein
VRIPGHRDHSFRRNVIADSGILITDSGILITRSGDRDH